MMKTRLNRALATCLVFAMMLSIMSVCAGAVSDPSAPVAKAQTNSMEVQAKNDATVDAKALLQKMGISGDAALEERVSTDLRLMEETVFRDVTEIYSIQDDGIVYAMPFEEMGVTDLITVKANDNGDKVISVTEGDKNDTWLYQASGHVYLNGLRMEACEYYDTEKVEMQGVSPARVGMQFTMSAAPTSYFQQGATSTSTYIKKSGYTYLRTTSKDSNIALSNPLKEFAVATVKNLFASGAKKLLVGSALSVQATVGIAVLKAALSTSDSFLEAAILKYGDSKALSCQIYKYANKNNDTLYAEFVYAVLSYPKVSFQGNPYIWGTREEGRAT